MARPRKEIEGGETRKIQTSFDKNDLDWIDKEMQRQGLNSRAALVQEAVKYYRWSKEYKRSAADEVDSILSDPVRAEQFADLVSQSVLRKIRERIP
jgi:hypothetical protein